MNKLEQDIELLERIDIKYFLSGSIEQSNYIVEKADEVNEAIEHILEDYKRVLKEAKRFENMYEAEHQIHLVRNEQLDRKQKAIIKCNELEVENKELKKENEILEEEEQKLKQQIMHLQKENAELKEKWDKDTHRLQNDLDVANAERIELAQQNEELKHKIEGQECVIETQAHNEEVYEKLVIKLEKENKLAKQALIKNCNIADERNQLLKENKELKEEKADYTTVYLKRCL